MRSSPITDALFSETRRKVLEATLLQPHKEWYLSELAQFLHTSPSSLQREVGSLSQAGILTLRREPGRRVLFRADMNSPIFTELNSLFSKTSGIVPVLQEELTPFDSRIVVAFVYGSVARSQEHSGSDVDLLLSGDIGLADIVPALQRAERRIARQVNPIVFSKNELSRRLQNHDHFLDTVMAGDKQFVKGSANELAAIVGQAGN